MSDKVVLTLDMPSEKWQKIEDKARRSGYNDPETYILALVEQDIEDDEDFEGDPEASFRQAWHEVMTGQTYPISTLWDFLDDE